MKFEFTGWQKIQNLKDYLHFLPSNQFKIYNMSLQLVTWTCVSICVRFRYKYLFIWHVMKHVLVGYSRRKYSTLKFSKCLTYLYNIWLWQIATLLHEVCKSFQNGLTKESPSNNVYGNINNNEERFILLFFNCVFFKHFFGTKNINNWMHSIRQRQCKCSDLDFRSTHHNALKVLPCTSRDLGEIRMSQWSLAHVKCNGCN